MAKHVITTTNLVDDIDGTTAERTVVFGYDGADYEIELSKKNIRTLEKLLEPYITNGRKVRGTRAPSARGGRRPAAAPASRRPDLREIREWANKNGFEVAPRGRVPIDVIEAYDRQHAA